MLSRLFVVKAIFLQQTEDMLMKNKHIWHSLSYKLILLFCVIAIIFLFTVGMSIKHAVENLYQQTGKAHIEKYLEYVRNDIGSPAQFDRAKSLSEQLNIDIIIIEPERYWSSSEVDISIRDLNFHYHKNRNGVIYGGADYNDQHFMLMKVAETHYLFNTTDIIDERSSARIFRPLLLLLIVLVILYFATKRLFAPILKIQDGVKKIGSGNLDHQIIINRRDELGILARDINKMADDIRDMLDAKRELLLSVSHELRTPLTRTNVALALMPDNTYKKQIQDDVSEMETLITYILETERLNNQHKILNLEKIDINKLLSITINEHFHQEAFELCLLKEPILIDLDVNRITLMIKSLLENALRYKRESVAIKVIRDNNLLTICIEDDGEGIPEAEISKITHAFYRLDPSRQRNTGTYGLGLYLAEAIVKAHKGSLEIDSELNKGTKVSITLPINS